MDDKQPANEAEDRFRYVPASSSQPQPQSHPQPQPQPQPQPPADDGDDFHNTPAPPAYSSLNFGHNVGFNDSNVQGGAAATEDGRIDMQILDRDNRLSKLLIPALETLQDQESTPASSSAASDVSSASGQHSTLSPPRMNVVIQVVGSRGDVQPFVALGKLLREKYGHRVRLATHGNFRAFVAGHGLEFFDIGGSPAQLMEFMVKNPGLVPDLKSFTAGDVNRRRKDIEQILHGCWRSCIDPGDGPASTLDGGADVDVASVSSSASQPPPPFVADAIIANPPSFAHVHVAEKLGIPLHVMFTMPWSPTQAFPHPLSKITATNTDPHLRNFVSYALVDMLMWQGLGDVINRFRESELFLAPLGLGSAAGLVHRLKIPVTYCWSPALLPKPRDWGSAIDVSGFFFLETRTAYTPPPDLAAFLAAGPPPIYIGFGSIVVDDPAALTATVLGALQRSGQRALVSRGWGNLGGASSPASPDSPSAPASGSVFFLGDCPHDWLFARVSCVVHHGGAGTLAAGLAAGCPTVVVPFFGDQFFWGGIVARAGAGPDPIHHKQLTAENLSCAIGTALLPETRERAARIAAQLRAEDGPERAARSFHRGLKLRDKRCAVAPQRAAVWWHAKARTRLSALAAAVLGSEELLDFDDLALYRPCEYDTDEGPWDPVSGGAGVLLGTLRSLGAGIADIPSALSSSSSTKKDHPPGSNGSRTPTIKSSASVPGSRRSSMDDVRAVSASDAARHRLEADFGPAPVAHQQRSMTSLHHSSTTSSHKSNGSDSSSTHNTSSSKRSRVLSAGIKAPMDLTLSIAKGFHNAPKLYGDPTVRKNKKVTGLASGLKEAGKELGLGFYDGFTGLITQPIKGAYHEGPVGLAKGLVWGSLGVLIKPGAAVFGLPGYGFKGIYMELSKHSGRSERNYVVAARMAQGLEELGRVRPDEVARIVGAWKALAARTPGVLPARTGSKGKQRAVDGGGEAHHGSIHGAWSGFRHRHGSQRSVNGAAGARGRGVEVQRAASRGSGHAVPAGFTSSGLPQDWHGPVEEEELPAYEEVEGSVAAGSTVPADSRTVISELDSRTVVSELESEPTGARYPPEKTGLHDRQPSSPGDHHHHHQDYVVSPVSPASDRSGGGGGGRPYSADGGSSAPPHIRESVAMAVADGYSPTVEEASYAVVTRSGYAPTQQSMDGIAELEVPEQPHHHHLRDDGASGHFSFIEGDDQRIMRSPERRREGEGEVPNGTPVSPRRSSIAKDSTLRP
ncbi:putative glycosyltransferase family 1 protein [Neofusicoccum parvum UCRNP2]|uniref:Putative glycosyltransferase family 1 protein n=1 Tax=Botryosphaeria parva (strain UCR-NP2) TaxID=1287680 RepID=R1GDE0_BOTPV|nr:putative glycosyltransferase family 1 protein [Neofusicoccum parvum UCRNP2]